MEWRLEMLVSFFDWMSAVYLSYLTVVHFFLLMISMQKPKKLLYCLFSSVEFIYFSSICFVLSVWQCVQLYPNTMGNHHMEHKLFSLSLSRSSGSVSNPVPLHLNLYFSPSCIFCCLCSPIPLSLSLHISIYVFLSLCHNLICARIY